jgi:hypothetical protein
MTRLAFLAILGLAMLSCRQDDEGNDQIDRSKTIEQEIMNLEKSNEVQKEELGKKAIENEALERQFRKTMLGIDRIKIINEELSKNLEELQKKNAALNEELEKKKKSWVSSDRRQSGDGTS